MSIFLDRHLATAALWYADATTCVLTTEILVYSAWRYFRASVLDRWAAGQTSGPRLVDHSICLTYNNSDMLQIGSGSR